MNKTLRNDPTRSVREIENLFITLRDGTKLAARIWLPEDAERDPVPAILEYLPYRKRDGTSVRDALHHPFVAARGYACVRVDIRGTGESDGVLADEYLKLEQDDCLEVLQWLERQPWCTGQCGMIGISWGGFNGLQVAARKPPQLKAIVTICSTDDRYADDIHTMGGCQLVDNVAWASTMFTLQSYPPDPALVGERWREMWIERLENQPLLIDNWLQHQRRDAFWKHGSVCENFADITAAVYAVGGWADGYSNAVPRLLSGLKGPKKGLVGPWAHRYPHFAEPGPRIGFLHETLRWWDQWLKGIDTGIMREPEYRVWMEDWVAPAPYYKERPGRWVAEPRWPSPNIAMRDYHLAPGALGGEPGPKASMPVTSPLSVGVLAGHWCPYGLSPDLPSDQRDEDGKSVVFDSAPLNERLEILGAAEIELEVTSQKPQAQLCVRLNDVAPDGASLRVSYGLLNLTHRDSHENPAPLEPGKRYRVTVRLNDAAHAFPRGHRIRIAISSSYWPIAWPSPEMAGLVIATEGSVLHLPVRTPRTEDDALPPFQPPEAPAPWPVTKLGAPKLRETVERDLVAGRTTFATEEDDGGVRHDAIGLDVRHAKTERFDILDSDPLSARVEIVHSHTVGRGDWQVSTKTATTLTATKTEFLIQARLDAFEAGKRVVTRNWDRRHRRDEV
jgi:putative CocE/NonD family hydrolase